MLICHLQDKLPCYDGLHLHDRSRHRRGLLCLPVRRFDIPLGGGGRGTPVREAAGIHRRVVEYHRLDDLLCEYVVTMRRFNMRVYMLWALLTMIFYGAGNTQAAVNYMLSVSLLPRIIIYGYLLMHDTGTDSLQRRLPYRHFERQISRRPVDLYGDITRVGCHCELPTTYVVT